MPPHAPQRGHSLSRRFRQRDGECLSQLHVVNGTALCRGLPVAARTLANQVLETWREQGILIFPIVYLYRHHVELILRRLTVIGAFIIDRELTDVEVRHLEKHRLDLLWNNFKPILQGVCKEASWKPLPQEDIDGVNSYIRQLTEVDPEAQSFRYAVTKKGERSVPEVKHINIRVFAEAMERLAAFLEASKWPLSTSRMPKTKCWLPAHILSLGT
jgi:hypothetical protein